MKKGSYISMIFMLLSCLVNNQAAAQNIRGDTIFLETNSVVAVLFPAITGKAALVPIDGMDALYEVTELAKRSIAIRALKKNAPDQALEVDEGGRKHLFILAYKDGSPARSLDFSTRKKLSAHVDENKQNVSRLVNEAISLYDQAKSGLTNYVLWEAVQEKYLQLLTVVEPKETGAINSRLEEARQQVKGITDKNYKDAIKNGEDRLYSRDFGDARKFFQDALGHRLGDAQAMKLILLTDSSWCKEYVDRGDSATKVKKPVLAKEYYKQALAIKPGYPNLQNKFSQARKEADPQILRAQQDKGNEAMKAFDFKEARIAYDSALSVSADNKYLKSQLVKVEVELDKIEQDKKKEAAYQVILASAKSLADKASNKADYEAAIKEYQLASDVFPLRKFPTKRIGELSKLKNVIK